MENKVFVLIVQRDYEYYSTSSEVLGVYKTRESGRAALQTAFEKEHEDWKNSCNAEDIKCENGSDCACIYDGFGGAERTEFELAECKVQD